MHLAVAVGDRDAQLVAPVRRAPQRAHRQSAAAARAGRRRARQTFPPRVSFTVARFAFASRTVQVTFLPLILQVTRGLWRPGGPGPGRRSSRRRPSRRDALLAARSGRRGRDDAAAAGVVKVASLPLVVPLSLLATIR